MPHDIIVTSFVQSVKLSQTGQNRLLPSVKVSALRLEFKEFDTLLERVIGKMSSSSSFKDSVKQTSQVKVCLSMVVATLLPLIDASFSSWRTRFSTSGTSCCELKSKFDFPAFKNVFWSDHKKEDGSKGGRFLSLQDINVHTDREMRDS